VLEGKLDGDWAFEDADAAYVLLDGLALKEEAAGLGRFLIEDFAHYVGRRKPIDRRVLLVVDEFSTLSMDADAANLFERVRSLGASVIVSSQSYAGLGLGADRILDAAAGLICHQSADPERLAARAGTRPSIERTIQIPPRTDRPDWAASVSRTPSGFTPTRSASSRWGSASSSPRAARLAFPSHPCD